VFIETELDVDSANLLPPPPIPPRQIKSDDKTTTPPPSLVVVKQSNPVNSYLIDNNNVNITKGLSICSKIRNNNLPFL